MIARHEENATLRGNVGGTVTPLQHLTLVLNDGPGVGATRKAEVFRPMFLRQAYRLAAAIAEYP